MRICILAELTLMLAWSPEEAGKILEIYKVTTFDISMTKSMGEVSAFGFLQSMMFYLREIVEEGYGKVKIFG